MCTGGELNAEGNLAWTGIPSRMGGGGRGGVEILLVASCRQKQEISAGLKGPMAHMQNGCFVLSISFFSCKGERPIHGPVQSSSMTGRCSGREPALLPMDLVLPISTNRNSACLNRAGCINYLSCSIKEGVRYKVRSRSVNRIYI